MLCGVEEPPRTRYALSGDVSIAYQTIGNGPLDLVFVPGFVSHLECSWEAPACARFFRRLAAFSRLILFDKRGTGMSDPVEGAPPLEQRMDDVRAVMDAVGSKRAALFGLSEGGPLSLLFAATYPERVSHLILFGTAARFSRGDPDYPWSVSEKLDVDYIIAHWGEGETMLRYFATSLAGNEQARRAFGRLERLGASPAMVRKLLAMVAELDVRAVLPAIHVPTLVLHRTHELFPVEVARYLATHIAGARLAELEGTDHLPWLGDASVVLAETERFLTGACRPAEGDRLLATVLFTDVVESTRKAAQLGDRAWSALLEQHNDIVRKELGRHRGHEVSTAGDGFFATFDRPAAAIRCARSIVDAVQGCGLQVRAGLHSGECEISGDDVRGLAVHIGARVAALAQPGEVLVSRTVKDLVVGSGITFDERGSHALKGVEGSWELYAARA